MPLYQHPNGERVRTVAGSPTDNRLAAAGDWRLVDDAAPADPHLDVRTGTGTAVVNLTDGE